MENDIVTLQLDRQDAIAVLKIVELLLIKKSAVQSIHQALVIAINK